MYEIMLNKQEEPTIAQMTAYCGASAELFTHMISGNDLQENGFVGSRVFGGKSARQPL